MDGSHGILKMAGKKKSVNLKMDQRKLSNLKGREKD